MVVLFGIVGLFMKMMNDFFFLGQGINFIKDETLIDSEGCIWGGQNGMVRQVIQAGEVQGVRRRQERKEGSGGSGR